MIKCLAFAALALLTIGCGGNKSNTDNPATAGLTGAGSTFINPIMTHWVQEYQQASGYRSIINPSVQVQASII
jgi:ABC-type phosphate transport system substrate-binding protein